MTTPRNLPFISTLHPGRESTHIWSLLRVFAIQHIPQHVHLGRRFDGDAGQHTVIVDISDQLAGVGLQLGRLLGALGGARRSGLVVEAVQVATGLLELLHPFLRLPGGKVSYP